VVMASLTRCKTGKEGVPNDIMVEYYRQRAEGAGLVLGEATAVHLEYNSFIGAAVTANDAQAEGWKKVTDAVHKEGAFMFAQLYSPGRVLTSKHYGKGPIAPSAIPMEGVTHVGGEKFPYEVPKEVDQADIEMAQQWFVDSAKIAKKGGFDGIEIHAANGYLVDQFLRTSTNKRTDNYGGSVENRARFLLEILDKVSAVYPFNQIGIKISPVGRYQGMRDDDPAALFKYVLAEVDKRGLAYVQIRESDSKDGPDSGDKQIPEVAKFFRPYFKGTLMSNGSGMDYKGPLDLVESGIADLHAFGWLFISNPDLPERIKNGYPLAAPDVTKLYGPGNAGYGDYPKHVTA
jgi:N-ethylmaleimide reductase